MGVRIISDGSGTQTKVTKLVRRVEDLTPMWPKVGRYMARTTHKQFTTKGAFLGTPWKPLKPEYRLWKVQNGYNRNILVMTGDMRDSFINRPMSIEKYHRQSATFGSKHKLAIYHQRGTRRNGKKHIPARPIMKTTRGVRKDIHGMIEDYILRNRT